MGSDPVQITIISSSEDQALNRFRVLLNEGRPPKDAIVIALSQTEQDNIRHNLIKYGELQKLRSGRANRYNEMRYRH